jgi:hypothetical protein
MLLFLAFGSTSLASFILDSAIFCDIYNISLGMTAFSSPFFSSVMCIDTQHINVHPNVRRLLMNEEDTYKAALAPHQNSQQRKQKLHNPSKYVLKYFPSTIIAVCSAFTLV